MVIRFINARVKERKRREYCRGLVQKAVTVAVRIKKDLDRVTAYIPDGKLADVHVLAHIDKKARRRVRALERIAKIQYEAWKIGFRTEPPFIIQRAIEEMEQAGK